MLLEKCKNREGLEIFKSCLEVCVNGRQKRDYGSISVGHHIIDSNLKLRILDVGVNARDYRHISIEQIAELMELTKIK